MLIRHLEVVDRRFDLPHKVKTLMALESSTHSASVRCHISKGSCLTIWNSSPNLELLNERGALCANGHLGIEILEAGED